MESLFTVLIALGINFSWDGKNLEIKDSERLNKYVESGEFDDYVNKYINHAGLPPVAISDWPQNPGQPPANIFRTPVQNPGQPPEVKSWIQNPGTPPEN